MSLSSASAAVLRLIALSVSAVMRNLILLCTLSLALTSPRRKSLVVRFGTVQPSSFSFATPQYSTNTTRLVCSLLCPQEKTFFFLLRQKKIWRRINKIQRRLLQEGHGPDLPKVPFASTVSGRVGIASFVPRYSCGALGPILSIPKVRSKENTFGGSYHAVSNVPYPVLPRARFVNYHHTRETLKKGSFVHTPLSATLSLSPSPVKILFTGQNLRCQRSTFVFASPWFAVLELGH